MLEGRLDIFQRLLTWIVMVIMRLLLVQMMVNFTSCTDGSIFAQYDTGDDIRGGILFVI